jgi:hypothetical protein
VQCPEGTRIVIVQGGYNDLRRGSSSAAVAANIEAILSRLKVRGRSRPCFAAFYNEPWEVTARALRRGLCSLERLL